MIVPNTMCLHKEILLVHCTQTLNYEPLHWVSRYPRPTSKLWNIRDLFTPGGWAMLFLTPSIMLGFYRLSRRLIPLHNKPSLVREELLLFPAL